MTRLCVVNADDYGISRSICDGIFTGKRLSARDWIGGWDPKNFRKRSWF